MTTRGLCIAGLLATTLACGAGPGPGDGSDTPTSTASTSTGTAGPQPGTSTSTAGGPSVSGSPQPGTDTGATDTDPTGGATSAETSASTGNDVSVSLVGVTFDANTHEVRAPGSDNWPVTWAANGEQYTTWGDGGGFGGTNSLGRVSLGFGRIEGGPEDYEGYNVWGGAGARNPATFEGKSYALIALDNILWAWVGVQPGDQFARMRLYRSDTLGATWTAAGPQLDTASLGGAFTHPNILNFGPGNADARDEFVYTYWSGPKAQGAGSSDMILLTRTPASSMDDLRSVEYFAGAVDGEPTWSSSTGTAAAVFTDPGAIHWVFRVVYIAGLDKYVLINNRHTNPGPGFPSPSFSSDIQWLQADEPWGPFTAFATLDNWMPPGASDNDRYNFFFDIPSKWQSDDGLEFTLVFSGVGAFDAWNTMRGQFEIEASGE